MPGIELLDYTRDGYITTHMRTQIMDAVHETLEEFTGKWPRHSNFRYTLAGPIDISDYQYILVVDGEQTENTQKFKDNIRAHIKHKVCRILDAPLDCLAVRYRLYDSSFG